MSKPTFQRDKVRHRDTSLSLHRLAGGPQASLACCVAGAKVCQVLAQRAARAGPIAAPGDLPAVARSAAARHARLLFTQQMHSHSNYIHTLCHRPIPAGDPGTAFYYILSGAVYVMLRDRDPETHKPVVLRNSMREPSLTVHPGGRAASRQSTGARARLWRAGAAPGHERAPGHNCHQGQD